jgi:hypothetical protein
MADINDRVGLGSLFGLPTLFSAPTLTTSTKATIAGGGTQTPNTRIRVTITNGSTTATVAWTIVKSAGANPNITADYNATTGGIAIPPGGSQTFSIPGDKDLYVAASASAPCNVASFITQT